VIVHDLDVLRASGRPTEAHTELIVDADTILARKPCFTALLGWVALIYQ